MIGFNARIEKLRKLIGELPIRYKITFKDGSEKITDTGGAINLCMKKNAVKIEELGRKAEDDFINILQELINIDPDELWGGEDEPI